MSISGALCAIIVAMSVLMAGACDDQTSSRPPSRPTSPAGEGTVDDPASADVDAVDLVGAPDFRFAYGDGSGWHGYNVLSVGADGTAVYTFFEYVPDTTAAGEPINQQQWRRAQFTLDAPTLAALRAELKQVDFWRLKKTYYNSAVADGSQRWAKVEAGGKRKGVFWNNSFPDPAERLDAFVKQRILGRNRAAIDAAPTIELNPKDVEPETYD